MRDFEGFIPPSPECELPEPIRPEGDAGIMVLETCPHCGKQFLLVNANREVHPTGERWLEAEAYWAENRRVENYIYEKYPTPRNYYFEEPYGVGGFDYPSDFYIEPPKNF